ncbi:hypothetical protein MKX01_035653 [Papaver californicum]|nr:hypothetical protein MKX01_035653 [Papaver californicum]
MASSSSSSISLTDQVARRARILTSHLNQITSSYSSPSLKQSVCLEYSPAEISENINFDTDEMRKLLDDHNFDDRDWLFGLLMQSKLFCPKISGGKVFVTPDFNQSKEQQREVTMKRIEYLLDRGVFNGWLTKTGVEAEKRKFALLDVIGIYDHSLAIKVGVHFFLWGGAIQFFGTKRHHDKWLKDTENYVVKGCFAMTELGHGSNVRGIETITTYDKNAGEFVINTPCESAQKYWIGGLANHATHTAAFSQLYIDGVNQGVHAFIVQVRDADGNVCPNIQRFAAFLAPLTSGRVTISLSSIYQSKIGLAIALRYSLTRRAFSVSPNGPEVLLLDYPGHQRRLLPLLAKTCAMSFGANYLKRLYINRTPQANKTIHVVSSAFKAAFTWHNMRTLQECREACGGQGLKTENRMGHLKSEYDVQSTFEGDNHVLMQQVSKALITEYIAAQKRKKPFKGLGLEHMNDLWPVIPAQLTSSILRSINFQMDIFFLRERDLLHRFASEVSQLQAQGESKENAFMLTYQTAEDLAKAFTERSVLQTFLKAEVAVSDGALKSVFGLLRSMYALISIEEDISFLRYGYLSPDKDAAVRKEVTKLCSELRPHTLSVVKSLGIPDAFLSPIAFDWVAANTWSPAQQ